MIRFTLHPRRSGLGVGSMIGLVLGVIGGLIGLVVGTCAIVAPTVGPFDDILNSIGGVDTRDLPGDARAFDPTAALPAVQAYAGDGARLVSIEMALIRADGTMDLEAGYTPQPRTTYTFAREVPQPANAPPPGAGGSAATGPWYEVIVIEAYEPGQRRRRTTNNSRVDYVNKGLERDVREPVRGEQRLVEAPRCDVKSMFAAAIAAGAPADAVARITYDATGYDFVISGLRISLTFAADCTERAR